MTTISRCEIAQIFGVPEKALDSATLFCEYESVQNDFVRRFIEPSIRHFMNLVDAKEKGAVK